MKSVALSFDALQHAVARLPASRLAVTRRAALEHLREHGLPTIRSEDWKYTDLAPIVAISNQSLQRDDDRAPSQQLDSAIADIKDTIEADWLIIANGLVDDQAITTAKKTGINVTRLSESDDDLEFSAPLSDLNAALLHDGLCINVESDSAPTRPIGILFIDDAAMSPAMSQARVEIEIAANCSANIIEYHVSLGSADHYANSVVNLTIGDGAHSSYVRLQERASNHNQTGRLSVDVGRDGYFKHCVFDFGGKLIRNDLIVNIAAPGSRSVFDGVYLIGEGQHIDNHTRANHRVGPAESQQEYRGILTGNARGIWNGKAIVHQGADGTDAAQANHNLLLSDKAEIDAKPELEIYADDVKCSHGTTVGQLDEAALFYLRTRGLSKHEAQRVLTSAFAQAIVSKSPITSIHELLAKKISHRLNELMHGVDT